jgi:hypothetical protein
MKREFRVLLVILVVMMAGCSAKRQTTSIMVPPRVDLTQHEMLGIIEFSSSVKGELGPLTTKRFTEMARRDQGMVRVLGLPSTGKVLHTIGIGSMGPEAIRALGREHGVRTVVLGELTVSDVKPDLQIGAGLRSGTLSGRVDATLAVEMLETETGASIWNTSARATHTVGHISVFRGGDFIFDAEDPEAAYGPLVDSLVTQVTRDFRVSWERR